MFPGRAQGYSLYKSAKKFTIKEGTHIDKKHNGDGLCRFPLMIENAVQNSLPGVNMGNKIMALISGGSSYPSGSKKT